MTARGGKMMVKRTRKKDMNGLLLVMNYIFHQAHGRPSCNLRTQRYTFSIDYDEKNCCTFAPSIAKENTHGN